jgi:hypothetical protein
MSKFASHKWWIATLVFTAPLLAQAEPVPNTFTAGTVISASQVNADFQNLADRLTAVEGWSTGEKIPDFTATTSTNAIYDAAKGVRLPVYQLAAGENGSNEFTAACKTNDILLSGGCVVRDAAGADLCFISRSYAIGNTWLCRGGKANGVHTDCRVSPTAVCLKSY